MFFNTPARRKFLRHIDTESRYITQALSQLAAAHPEVALQLKHQERQVLDLRPAERVDRAGELLGAPPDELLVSDWETSGLSIHVILCPPALCKRSRGKQFLIVRGRAIYSRALSSAVYAGYGGLLPHNAHPAYVLWLDLDPRQVDVNVHPTKREVRFADERGVGESVRHAVRQALNMPEVPAFASPWPETKRAREPVAGEALGSFHTSPAGGSPAGDPEADQLELSMLAPSTPSATPLAEADSVIAEEAMGHLRASRSMWQLHNKYLLAAIPDGLALIDQHVAHERIRYEEIIDCLEAEGGTSQQLLLPVTFDVTPVEMDVFKEASALLEKLGFSIREFGPESLIVDGIPTELTNWGDGEILRQILSDFQEDVVEAGHEGREALAASMACHSSIRAGEALAGEEMTTLVSRLLKTREPFNCPHGRPIILKIPLKEFDRLFGRT